MVAAQVEDRTHKRLKALAKKMDISMSTLVRRGLIMVLNTTTVVAEAK
jgi:hypothetical protein